MKDHFKENLIKSYNNDAKRRADSSEEEWKVVEKEKFKDLLIKEGKKNLLELGAGTGKDSLYFSQHKLDVVATDLSEEMIRHCLEKGLEARVMDFYNLKFGDNTFEGVYAMNSLLHVPKADLKDVLEEIKRVLKPGGIFFMGVYGGKDSEGIYEDDWCEPKRFFSFYRDEDIQRVLEGHFQIEAFKPVTLDNNKLKFQSIILRNRL